MNRLLLVVILAAGYGAGCSMGEQAMPAKASESKGLSGEATSAGLACYNILKAEVNKATLDQSKIEAACAPAGAITKPSSSALSSDGPDPNLIAWCDEGGCCIAGD